MRYRTDGCEIDNGPDQDGFFATATSARDAERIAAELNRLDEALRVAVAENEAWRNIEHDFHFVAERMDEMPHETMNDWTDAQHASDQNDQIRRVRGEVKDGH